MSTSFSRRQVLGGVGATAAGLVGGVGGAVLLAPPAHALGTAFIQLARVMNGQQPDLNALHARMGSNNPLDMFNGGGSENIPVVARTALYVYGEHVIRDRDWLWNYYNHQLVPGGPYFLEDEIFSAIYTQAVVGCSIVVRDRALALGHTGLANKSTEFLRKYWAFLSLAALDLSPNTWVIHNRDGTITKNPGAWWGYNLGLVGRRSYPNGTNPDNPGPGGKPGYGLQGVLLAMALQHPNRAVTADLRASPGFYGGMRAAVESVGYNLDGNGKVNLQSMSVPPEKFGLTGAERTLLFNFIATRAGNGTTQDVVALLGNQQIDSDLTIIRSDWWVTSWWGRSGQIGNPPGDAKGGPTFIVRARRPESDTTFVTRSDDRWGQPQGGTTWRDGNNICAEGALPELCVAYRVGGSIRYEITLSRNGVQCIAGNC